MKKFIAITFFTVFIGACSSDGSDSSSHEKLSKVIDVGPNGEYTVEYFYDGDKLDYITYNDGDRTDYTYSGNLITMVERESETGDVLTTMTYSYDSQQRVMEEIAVEHSMDYGSRSEFIYNGDGTITVKVFYGNSQEQSNLYETVALVYNSAGEIASATWTGGVNSNHSEYVFDNKKNPLRNVTGMDKISFLSGKKHNLLSETRIQNGNNVSQFTNSFTYNPQGYPVTSERNFNGEIHAIEFQYQ